MHSGQTLEFGDLHVRAAGAIRGRVLLPAGATPEGLALEFKMDIPRVTHTILLDAEGQFEARGLTPGRYTLDMTARAGEIRAGNLNHGLLRPGEVLDLTLDARTLGVTWLDLAVRLDGEPAPASSFGILPLNIESRGLSDMHNLGTLREGGHFEGYVSAVGAAEFKLRHDGRIYSAGEHHLQLEPGTRVQARVDLLTATLRITYSGEWPEEGYLELLLSEKPGAYPFRKVFVPIDGAVPKLESCPDMQWIDGQIRWLRLPACACFFQARVGSRVVAQAKPDPKARKAGSPFASNTWLLPPDLERKVELDVQAGAPCLVRLE
ncbi:MAG: carboxypeptidase-like regulatory domain-containing protein [Planctomycetota bacterium]